MTTATGCSQSTGLTCPDTETCERSEPETSHQLTLSVGASPVSRTVLPGSDEARQMTETSGRKCAASLPSSDPAGWWVRMFLESSATPTSTRCLLTWKRKATPAGRSVYQLSPSMPRTDECESGLWPTPQANESTESLETLMTRGERQYGRASRNGKNLTAMARLWPTPSGLEGGQTSRGGKRKGELLLAGAARMWPTPAATDANPITGGELYQTKRGSIRARYGDASSNRGLATAVTWPTPRSTDGSHGGRVTPRKARNGGNLIEAVSEQMYPTPTSRDWRSGKASAETMAKNSRPLSEAIGGQLNPQFVSWLMGFPLDWCDMPDELPLECPTESPS